VKIRCPACGRILFEQYIDHYVIIIRGQEYITREIVSVRCKCRAIFKQPLDKALTQ